MSIFDIFKRKNIKAEPAEERKVNLGGLMFSNASNFSSTMATKLSAVYCATAQISNALAMLPINIVKYDSDEKRPIQHPLWKVLNVSPEKAYNHFNSFKMAIESVILQGNAYFYIIRDKKLNVEELRYINAEFVQPMPQADGSIRYIVQGFPAAVDGNDMVHLFLHCDEMHNGISLIKYACRTLGSAIDAEETSNKFYRSGAGLNGILKASATLTNEQKKQIRDSWNQAFTEGGSGVAVLPQGLDYQAVSVSPEDAQLLETRKFNIEEIARFFCISPIKLQVLGDISYNSLEATELNFLYDTVAPYVQMIKEEFNRKLFKPSEVGVLGVDFDYTSAMQTNRKDLGEYYRMMITNGLMTVDEVRGQLGLAKLNTPGSTTTFIQLSYGSADDIAEGKYIKQKETDQVQDPNGAKVVKD